MSNGNPDPPQVTGKQMPVKRNRKPMSIFVIGGAAAIKEFKDIQAAEKAMTGKDFVVIRGHKLQKHVTVSYL